jgi:hypothetical protein
MKILKIILGAALLAIPFSIHVGDSSWGRVVFMMAPIGAYATLSIITGDYFYFTPHSFKWYSRDGLIEYNSFYNDAGEMGAGFWFTDFIPFGRSAAGLLTIIVLWALVLYVILSFFDKKEISILADFTMIACSIMSLVAMILYLDSSWASFDFNFPIFPILAAILGIVGLVKSIKSKRKRKRRR